MFRNKVGGEEEERRHLLLDAEFIQKLLFTARTKTSIELLISGSLDSLKKRDLEEALIPTCVATAFLQVPSERTRHVFLTASLQLQDGQFSSGMFILCQGFQPRCTESICLQLPTLVPPDVASLLPASFQNLHMEYVTRS